jgi:hypothetical protein
MAKLRQVKAGMVNKNVHKGKKTGNRKSKGKKMAYKVGGRVNAKPHHDITPMGRVPVSGPAPLKGPLTTTAAVAARMKASGC